MEQGEPSTPFLAAQPFPLGTPRCPACRRYGQRKHPMFYRSGLPASGRCRPARFQPQRHRGAGEEMQDHAPLLRASVGEREWAFASSRSRRLACSACAQSPDPGAQSPHPQACPTDSLCLSAATQFPDGTLPCARGGLRAGVRAAGANALGGFLRQTPVVSPSDIDLRESRGCERWS